MSEGRSRADEHAATVALPGSAASDPPELGDAGDPLATAPRERDPAASDPYLTRPRAGSETDPDSSLTRLLRPPGAAGGGGDMPQRVGDYLIESFVASGGMGVVYRARQVKLERVVALKMIRRGDAAGDDEIRRFLSEAQAAARLDHSGIVSIYEVGEDAGRHFFSMALVEGGSLADRLATGPLESREAATLLRAVAAAVAYAHERGVVHRDLKPSNILLDTDGTPKVTDFGLAKRVDTRDDLTLTGQVLGTPSYMPPEQARGDGRTIGPLADVYALGAVLYHALTGRPPFAAATVVATLRQVLETEPLPPRRLVPQVARDLETIALKCLEKEPGRRYDSAAAVNADLDRFLTGEPILARPASLGERGWKWARRRPAAALLAVVSLVAAASMLVGAAFYADAAHKRAELATRLLREQQAIEATRQSVQEAALRAGDLLRDGDLAEADGVVREATARIGMDGRFSLERGRLSELRDGVERLRATRQAHAAARERLAEFGRLRDAAVFHGALVFGIDPRRNQRLAAAEARQALALWGLDDPATAATGPVMPPEHYSEEERRRTRAECEELLLVEADATIRAADADTLPAAKTAALAAIDRCRALLGRETRATRLGRAECLALAGDAAAATEQQRLADETAAHGSAADHFLVGKVLLQRGLPVAGPAGTGASDDFARARAEFEQALLADPDHFWAQYGLALHALRGGRPDLAEVHLTSCIARRPEFGWSWLLRGEARTALGTVDGLERGEQDFERALERFADDPEGRYVALVGRGVLAFRRGRHVEARRLLADAIALEPAAYQALLTLATVEAGAGQRDEALRLLDRVVTLEPKLALARRERAKLHAASAVAADPSATSVVDPRREIAAADLARERAAADFAAAAGLEHGDRIARCGDLVLLGEMRFRQGRFDEALAAWDEALAIDPDEPRAHLWRAVLWVERKEFARAVPEFDSFLRRGRPDARFHLTRGMCRASLADFAGAIDDYSRAIDLEPSAETHAQRGWLYALRGNPLFGLQDFERALDHDVDHADAHAGRGLALAHLGRHADAAAAAERALELADPSFRTAYKVATVFAAAAPRVVLSAEERKQQGPSERQLGIRYLTRAAELLRHALSHEHPDRHDELWEAHVENDPHFRPLVQEPEFRKVWREVFEAADREGMSGATASTPGGNASARTAQGAAP
jgi:tetratricopeptide (TPR) repeat protein